MNEKEREIEKYFVWAVMSIGGLSYKFKSPTKRGVADQVACLPNGQTWFVELKRTKGGIVSALQAEFANDMIRLQQRYALLSTKEQINVMRAVLHACAQHINDSTARDLLSDSIK